MKLKLALVILSLLVVLVTPVMAKPTSFTVPYNQAQFQWRASPIANPSQIPFGDWSDAYQNDATSDDYTLTGNVLHMSISYSPSVTDLQGASTVYVYNGTVWIQREGTISYTSPYSGLTITEYWRGYLSFSSIPSAFTFLHGVGYQWGYVYGVDEATVKAKYPIAVWDGVMQAWLVGFSIYLWDSGTQTYDDTPPYTNPAFQFIEPVPADNYNPLGL